MTPGVVLAFQDRITSWIPAPDRLTVCELPLALSEIMSAAVRAPLAEGVNITAIVQLAPAATELPQMFVSAKSLTLVPVMTRLVIFNVVFPVLLMVTICPVLVKSIGWLPKARLVDERLSSAAVLEPATERFTIWGLPLALSAMMSVAVQGPLAEGVKVTLIAQLAPAATELPQLSV